MPDFSALDPRVVKAAHRELIRIASNSLGMRIKEFLSSSNNFERSIPELNNQTLKPLLDYWGSLPELIIGLDGEALLSSQLESDQYQLYATYWAIVLVADIVRQIEALHPQAEFTPENLHRIAWVGSFGHKRIEPVVMALEGIKGRFLEPQQHSTADWIIRKILVFLTERKMVQIVGVDAFEESLAKLEDRIVWVRQVIEQQIADKNLLLEQLREEIEF